MDNPHVYFSFCRSPSEHLISHLTVVTDSASKESWKNYLDSYSIIKKKVLLEYRELKPYNVKKKEYPFKTDSLIIFDDLSPDVYETLKVFITYIFDCVVHHYNLVFFTLVQNVVKCSLSSLISKANQIHICSGNVSCYRTLKYLGIYHFPSAQRTLLSESYSLSQNYDDNYIILLMKINPGETDNRRIFVNSWGYLNPASPPLFNIRGLCVVLGVSGEGRIRVGDRGGGFQILSDTGIITTASDISSLTERYDSKRDFYRKMYKESDRYVCVPEAVVADIIRHLESKKDNFDNSNDDEIKKKNHLTLQNNLKSAIKTVMPPRKISSSVRIADELLLCPYVQFLGVSGRSLRVDKTKFKTDNPRNDWPGEYNEILSGDDSDDESDKIKTLDYLLEMSKKPLPFSPAFKTKKKPKKMKIEYKLLCYLLIRNDCPAFIFVNNRYIAGLT